MDAKQYNANKNKVKVSSVKSLSFKDKLVAVSQDSDYFGSIPTVRVWKDIDKNADMWVELDEWADTTTAIHISEFCSPRKFSYKMLKKGCETDPRLKEALEKAMDKVAQNIREKWQLDYRMGELCKMYLPIFDSVVKEHRMELTKMVSEKIAANAGTTINIIDSSGYLSPKDKEDTRARAREAHDTTIEE